MSVQHRLQFSSLVQNQRVLHFLKKLFGKHSQILVNINSFYSNNVGYMCHVIKTKVKQPYLHIDDYGKNEIENEDVGPYCTH